MAKVRPQHEPRKIQIARQALDQLSSGGRRASGASRSIRIASARPAKAPAFDPAQPALLNRRYRILGALGEGGMGIVYKAHDTVLNLVVAVKFLPERLLYDPVCSDRFRQEAALVMQLSHEHIVKLHNLEIDNNRMYMVMEFVQGRDFRTVLREYRALSLATVLQVAKSCAMALDYAHERGVLHLDLKPENLMLTDDSLLKIVDFGTARYLHGLDDREGVIEGSPPYMAPEQIRGEEMDRRTDVYALGAILYELLSGVAPFPFDVDFKTVLEGAPEPLKCVPLPVADIIAQAMAKDRLRRWPSAGELYGALRSTAEAESSGSS